MACCKDWDVWRRLFSYPRVCSSSLEELGRNPQNMDSLLGKFYGSNLFWEYGGGDQSVGRF
eukprot:10351669-Karenia_brevis.AAC.1